MFVEYNRPLKGGPVQRLALRAVTEFRIDRVRADLESDSAAKTLRAI